MKMQELLKEYRRVFDYNPTGIARDVAEAAIYEFNTGDWHWNALRDTSNKIKETSAKAIEDLQSDKPCWVKYEV